MVPVEVARANHSSNPRGGGVTVRQPGHRGALGADLRVAGTPAGGANELGRRTGRPADRAPRLAERGVHPWFPGPLSRPAAGRGVDRDGRLRFLADGAGDHPPVARLREHAGRTARRDRRGAAGGVPRPDRGRPPVRAGGRRQALSLETDLRRVRRGAPPPGEGSAPRGPGGAVPAGRLPPPGSPRRRRPRQRCAETPATGGSEGFRGGAFAGSMRVRTRWSSRRWWREAPT